ncbi:LysR substrate-binding domain-containing protein [Amphibiibacter pelophylacis]|uniref:LysR substrate-binding domain-containing protein n=1 Tax=Amphibiibacter pelophylacis TaxID=1799477 RepID=A0ACC6P0S5_9BURK
MDLIVAMRTFVKVAEMQSFAAVAAQADAPRSWVSRQMSQLEAHLKVQLLTRSTRRLALTSEGESYLAACRDILQRIDEAESQLACTQHELRGPLRLSLPHSFGLDVLMPDLVAFQCAHPGITLDLDFNDRRVNLIEEQSDLALRITRDLHDLDIVRRLGSIDLRVVASPAYWDQTGRPDHPQALRTHRGLLYTSGQRNAWRFSEGGHELLVDVQPVLQASSGSALVQAALAGLGVTVQPQFLVHEHLASGRLEAVLDSHRAPPLGVYAVLPSQRHIPQRVRALIDHLAQSLEQRREWLVV